VSAETASDVNPYKLNELPGLSRVSRAVVDIPINRYSIDPFELMSQAVTQWRAQRRTRPQVGESVSAPDADSSFINARLTEVADPEAQARLMTIPTCP